MATRVTDGARRERHEKRDSFFFSGCRPRFARLAASPLPRACIALTKSEEKERLLAVYVYNYLPTEVSLKLKWRVEQRVAFS